MLFWKNTRFFGVVLSLVAGLVIVMTCTDEEADQYRYGLWSSEVISDQCQISDIVERYFSSGEVEKIPDSLETPREKIMGYSAYNADEVGHYKLNYHNKFNYLLKYIIFQNEFTYKPNCFTKMDIETSTFSPQQNRFVRDGISEIYSFTASDDHALCLSERLKAYAPHIDNVSVKACVHIESFVSDFDVDIRFAPTYIKQN